MSLRVVLSNRFKKDLKLAKRRGLDLELLNSVVTQLASGFPNIEAHAKAASRIRAERDICLASARASSVASSSGVNRTTTT